MLPGRLFQETFLSLSLYLSLSLFVALHLVTVSRDFLCSVSVSVSRDIWCCSGDHFKRPSLISLSLSLSLSVALHSMLLWRLFQETFMALSLSLSLSLSHICFDRLCFLFTWGVYYKTPRNIWITSNRHTPIISTGLQISQASLTVISFTIDRHWVTLCHQI